MNRIMRSNVPPPRPYRPGDEIEPDAPNDDQGTVLDTSPARPRPSQEPPRDVLPVAARAKLIALEGEANDAKEAAASAARRMGDLRKSLTYSANANPNAAAIDLELTRLDKVRAAQDRRHRELAALVANINEYVRTLGRNAVLEPARPSTVKPNDGESVLDAIERIRREIAQTEDVLASVELAPPPKAVLKQQARDHVAALAKRARPRLSIDRGMLNIRWSDPESYGGSSSSDMPRQALLNGDKMVAVLEGLIDEMPEPRLALTMEQRTQRMADIKGSLADLARFEEALVTKAIEQGIDVLRRPDADPRAVLGIVVKPRKVQAAA